MQQEKLCALQDMSKILPRILDCVRLIWAHSRFFNTPECITGLLRRWSGQFTMYCNVSLISLRLKLSPSMSMSPVCIADCCLLYNYCAGYGIALQANVLCASRVSYEYIARCRAAVSMSMIFDKDVHEIMGLLHQCIAAGRMWRTAYAAAAATVHVEAPGAWAFDEALVFAHSEAFVQRCRHGQPSMLPWSKRRQVSTAEDTC